MPARLRPALLRAVLFMFLHGRGLAAFEQAPSGAFSASTGGGGVAVPGGVRTLGLNPAGLIGAGYQLSISSDPGPFGLVELRRVTVGVAAPAGGFFPALGFERSGFELYQEITATLAAGFRLTDRVAVGCALAAYHLTIEGYGSAAAFGLTAGVQVGVGNRIRFGAVVRNWNVPLLGRERERIDPEAVIGLEWIPATALGVTFDVSKHLPHRTAFHIGFRFAPAAALEIRGGAQSHPGQVSAGIGVTVGAVLAEYACRVHPVLGETHTVTLTLGLAGE